MSIEWPNLAGVELPTIVTGLLTIWLAVLSADKPRWEAREVRTETNNARILDLVTDHYRARPTGELYALVPRLALEAADPRKQQISARAALVDALPDKERQAAVEIAKRWISTVGRFAREAGSEYRLSMRPFLATYHLGVIREGAVVLPIAVSALARGDLDESESELLAWGAALVRLGEIYNGVARQQRQPVYFTASDGQPPSGPILLAPGRLGSAARDPLDLAWRRMRPTWSAQGRWRRKLARMASELAAARALGDAGPEE